MTIYRLGEIGFAPDNHPDPRGYWRANGPGTIGSSRVKLCKSFSTHDVPGWAIYFQDAYRGAVVRIDRSQVVWDEELMCPGWDDREPTFISVKRAREIWDAKGPAGDFTGTCTAHENAEIHRVWKTLSGSASWSDALISITQGRHREVSTY